MTPFECDLSIFQKLRKDNPKEGNLIDDLLMGVIQRMNPNALWSRETSTVVKNASRARSSLDNSKLLGLTGPYKDKGRYPFKDHCGYKVDAVTLIQSRKPGCHSPVYMQFGAIRKLRSTF